MYKQSYLFFALPVSCHAAYNETSKFLAENGFGHVSEQFVREEIEVRQIAGLPDEILVALGVRTVGARLRLRSLASQWVQSQVISFFTQEISFLNFFPVKWTTRWWARRRCWTRSGSSTRGWRRRWRRRRQWNWRGVNFLSLTKKTGLFSHCNFLF